MKKFLSAIALCVVTLTAGVKPERTYQEPDDPVEIADAELSKWDKVGKLEAIWGTVDSLYSRSLVPSVTPYETFRLEGWKGERLSAQLLLYTGRGLENVVCGVADLKSGSHAISGDLVKAQFVRYTIADKSDRGCTCGRSVIQPAVLNPDMIDTLSVFNMKPMTVRPVWVTIDLPHDAVPGIYTSEIIVSAKGIKKIRVPFEVEVIDQTLPLYSDWKFHLDLWQHPSAVARVNNVPMWSDAHFEALKVQMEPLARAGQKVITATLNMDPWHYQTFDDYEDMIIWIKNADGSWTFDYTIFDRWVELMMSLGIDKQINCYSMLPWQNKIQYLNAARNAMHVEKLDPSSEKFEEYWGRFLTDFKKHLKEKGWLEITNIAVDERKPEAMVEANRVLMKYAPEIGFAMADKHASYRRFINIKDCCVAQRQLYLTKEELAERRAKGFVTTFYVCCSTFFPNNFTYSQPFESELLCWHAIARDYDGMLRWAYNSWPYDPQQDSRFRSWGSGDTYMMGTFGRSTLRFEQTRNGIEAYEKVQILRQIGADRPEILKPLEDKIKEFDSYKLTDNKLPWSSILKELNSILNKVSRELAK